MRARPTIRKAFWPLRKITGPARRPAIPAAAVEATPICQGLLIQMRRNPAKAIAVLDAMLEFFDGGRRWMTGLLAGGLYPHQGCLIAAHKGGNDEAWADSARARIWDT